MSEITMNYSDDEVSIKQDNVGDKLLSVYKDDEFVGYLMGTDILSVCGYYGDD